MPMPFWALAQSTGAVSTCLLSRLVIPVLLTAAEESGPGRRVLNPRTECRKRAVHVFQSLLVDVRQRKPVFRDQQVTNRLQVFGVQRFTLLDAGECVEDFDRRRFFRQSVRALARKQP